MANNVSKTKIIVIHTGRHSLAAKKEWKDCCNLIHETRQIMQHFQRAGMATKARTMQLLLNKLRKEVIDLDKARIHAKAVWRAACDDYYQARVDAGLLK